MVELIFDDYEDSKNLGQFDTAKEAWDAMVDYLKTRAGLNHDPYYYNVHEYETENESGVNVGYGSYTRFFRMIGAKISDLQSD